MNVIKILAISINVNDLSSGLSLLSGYEFRAAEYFPQGTDQLPERKIQNINRFPGHF